MEELIYYHLTPNSTTKQQTVTTSSSSSSTFQGMYLTTNAEHLILTLLQTAQYVMHIYRYNSSIDKFVKLKEVVITFSGSPNITFVNENASIIIGKSHQSAPGAEPVPFFWYECDLDHCVGCSFVGTCSNCESGFIITNGVCGCSANQTLVNNSCLACNITNCATCGSNNVCSICSNGYHLSNNSC